MKRVAQITINESQDLYIAQSVLITAGLLNNRADIVKAGLTESRHLPSRWILQHRNNESSSLDVREPCH